MGILTIGIDISKEKFDVCLENQDQQQNHKTFMNTQAGFKKLAALFEEHQVTACLEATGVYGENLCQFLHDQGVRVFLINPAQIKYYAKSMMKRSKTDKIDAAVIMQFIKLHNDRLTPWQPRSAQYNQLQSLYRCLKTFKLDRIRVQGCIEACSSTDRAGKSDALQFYEEHMKHLDHQIEKLQAQLEKIIETCAELKTHYQNLQTIPGVGRLSAVGILAEIPDIRGFDHVKQIVAYAGLNPLIKQSGSSVNGNGHISKQGSKDLRNVLYMSALVGKNACKVYRPFVDRLKEKGKKPKVIVVALMHKILRIVFTILRKGIPFHEATLRA